MWWLVGVAHGLEVGSSLGMGGDIDDGDFGFGGGYGGTSFPPSLDLYFEPVVLQIHVLDTLAAALNEDLFLGANLYVHVLEQPIGSGWQAVVQPGASLDLSGNPVSLGIAFECRLGAQVHQQAGFGFYLVPALGIVTNDGEAQPLVGGGLQLSVWFGAGGGAAPSNP